MRDRFSDLVGSPLDELPALLAHRPQRAAHNDVIRDDVAPIAAMKSGDGQHRGLGDVDLTALDRLQHGDDLRAHGDRVDAGPRERGVRLSSGHGNLEFVRAGLGYAGMVGEDSRLQGADHVQPEDGVRLRLEGAFRKHPSRAADLALWQILLCGLEYQRHRAAKLVTMGGQYFGDRHQNGGVAIMPAGMHHSYVLTTPIGPCDGREGQARRLRYRQRVHVSAECNARARTAAADQRRHHARHRNLFPHLVTQRAQVLRDDRGSPGFLVAKLWVLMNVSSPPDHSCFDRGRGRVQSLVDRTRRRSHNFSCERALWDGPDQRAYAAGACPRNDFPTIEAVGRRGFGQERASCLSSRMKDGLHGTPHLRCIAVKRPRGHSTILLRGKRQQVWYWMICPYGDARAKAAARKPADFWGQTRGNSSPFALVAKGRNPDNCAVRSRDRQCPLHVDSSRCRIGARGSRPVCLSSTTGNRTLSDETCALIEG